MRNAKKRMLHYGYNNVEKSVVQADITSPDILDKIKQVAAETKTDVIIGGHLAKASQR